MFFDIYVAREIDSAFTYKSVLPLMRGQIVQVNFRNNELWGVVKGPARQAHAKAKEVEHISLWSINLTTLHFLEKCADYNMLRIGQVIKMALPFTAKDLEILTRKESLVPFSQFDDGLLSDIQKQAAHKLYASHYQVSLLDGVTGSGKTEVYFAVIDQILKQDKQVLILLPEIGLTLQWIQRFEQRFGFVPFVWHSNITKTKKRNIWFNAVAGKPCVVVGARSALFIPFKKLGLIVVDEEHDPSYKQSEQGNYQGRDMSVLRAQIENIPIILASATPSLESSHNVQQGKYKKISLDTRFFNVEMPSIELIDMKNQPTGQWISHPLKERMDQTLGQKQQILLFLNRRGYAPLTLCKQCGHRFMCPGCDSWLVEHRHSSILSCHHCGFHMDFPPYCTKCHADSSHLVACGPGVERVLENVQNFFPDARVLAITSDLMHTVHDMAKAITAIEQGQVDIIIGTQMLAKGHHFKNLTLVGVIDGDMGLRGGDLRANEKTFQLLHQVSGRAGRELLNGHVLIQTYDPTSELMQAMVSKDRNKFYEVELRERLAYDLPPFSRLVALVISGLNEQETRKTVFKLASAYQPYKDVEFIGPALASIAKIRHRTRWRILLRAKKNVNIQKIIHDWLRPFEFKGSIRILIDIDPYDFH